MTDRNEDFLRVSEELISAIDAVIATWVVTSIQRIAWAYSGELSSQLLSAAEEAGQETRASVMPKMRSLLSGDVDSQKTTPLSLLRDSVIFPTRVLSEAGIPPLERDGAAEGLFPADIYDLNPARLADVDPSLGELGIVWGAMKARIHMDRHRPG